MNTINRRSAVLAGIVVFGTLSIVVSARQAMPKGPTRASLNATKIEKVRENLYVITGSSMSIMDAFSGGNTAVLVTDAGVVLVDTKLPGWGKPIIDRIKAVTDKPITTIINTHTHDDHTGSNDFFGASVETIVHENTRTNMTRMDAFKGEKAKFLPKRTYKDKLSLGKVRIRSTSTTSASAIPTAIRSWCSRRFASCTPATCSRGKRSPTSTPPTAAVSSPMPRRFARWSRRFKNVDTVITGHTPVLTWNELSEYADFNRDFVSWAQEQIKAGKAVGEAAAAYQVPAKYKGYSVSPNPQFGDAKANIEIVYKELKK